MWLDSRHHLWAGNLAFFDLWEFCGHLHRSTWLNTNLLLLPTTLMLAKTTQTRVHTDASLDEPQWIFSTPRDGRLQSSDTWWLHIHIFGPPCPIAPQHLDVYRLSPTRSFSYAQSHTIGLDKWLMKPGSITHTMFVTKWIFLLNRATLAAIRQIAHVQPPGVSTGSEPKVWRSCLK